MSRSKRISGVACVVRHVAFEDLGSFEAVLVDHGFELRVVDAGVDALTSALVEADLAVVLGGPIGVYEEAAYPFLASELALLQRRLAARRPTLGICLGAQLMAKALGARVYPGGQKEIGCAPVELTRAGRASCLAALEGQPVVHWHGDTFDLPAGAERLASTALYENQAFRVGENLLGLQFHPEVEARSFERWLIGHAGELASAGIDIPALRGRVREAGDALRTAGTTLLERWLEQIEH